MKYHLLVAMLGVGITAYGADAQMIANQGLNTRIARLLIKCVPPQQQQQTTVYVGYAERPFIKSTNTFGWLIPLETRLL